MLTTINRSALVMYSAEQMFHLVNDVESYPQYMEGCVGASILEHGDRQMVAQLDLKKSGVSMSFVTRNSLFLPESIKMELEQGPFKRLSGEWTFKPLTENACKVTFLLEFETNSLATTLASSSLFSTVGNTMVDALCQRADTTYGKTA